MTTTATDAITITHPTTCLEDERLARLAWRSCARGSGLDMPGSLPARRPGKTPLRRARRDPRDRRRAVCRGESRPIPCRAVPTARRTDLRNVAIVAHVDHGKTT